MRHFIILLVLLGSQINSFSQCNFQYLSQYDYPPFNSPLTNQIDKLGRPYLYVASNEFGLRIFKTSTGIPVLNNTLDTNDLFMRVMRVSQYDTLLYLAIGSHFDTVSDDSPGMVIVSVADPENPVVLNEWIHTSAGMGAGIVKVEGDFAYVGGMHLGLFIVNIADPNNIFLVGSFLPTNDFPIPNPPTGEYEKFNARGMEIKNGIVYLCNDRGGLHIINCTNPATPFASGRYVNPITVVPNYPRAYNNIIINDTVAYVSVDYCGIEIIDIRDTSNLQLLDHYNPYNCPTGTWWTSSIHANDMEYISDCNLLMFASGKSELQTINVADPTNVSYCGGYGSLTDTSGVWGVSFRNDTLYLSYVFSIYIPPFTPFWAVNPGIRMIKWTDHCAVSVEEESKSELIIYPNPAETKINFTSEKQMNGAYFVITDIFGKLIYKANIDNENEFSLDVSTFSNGFYFIKITSEEWILSKPFIISK